MSKHTKSRPASTPGTNPGTNPGTKAGKDGRKPRGRNRKSSGGTGGAGGNRYWLTGTHPVTAALANPERRCARLLATRNAAPGIEAAASARGLSIEEAERADLDKLAGPDSVHQGLALEVHPLEPLSLGDLPPAQPGRPLLVLDQVTDPRNVGAVLRSAAVFGAVAVLVQDRHAPPETAVLAKAASGALETLPMVRVGNLVRALDDAKQAGYWITGLAGAATETLADLPKDRPLALVLGAEGDGMRRLTREACDGIVKIAMAPNAVGSLNVSNAAAVALYAASTQQD